MISEKTKIEEFLKDYIWAELFHYGIQGGKVLYHNFDSLSHVSLNESINLKQYSESDIEVIISNWTQEDSFEKVQCALLFKTYQNHYVYLEAQFDGFGNMEHLTNYMSENLNELLIFGDNKLYQNKLKQEDVQIFLEKDYFNQIIENNQKKQKLKV
jgi:hypothetical protein